MLGLRKCLGLRGEKDLHTLKVSLNILKQGKRMLYKTIYSKIKTFVGEKGLLLSTRERGEVKEERNENFRCIDWEGEKI